MKKGKNSTRNREDIQEFHIYFPIDLYNEIKAEAVKQRRTMNGQILFMLEKQAEELKK